MKRRDINNFNSTGNAKFHALKLQPKCFKKPMNAFWVGDFVERVLAVTEEEIARKCALQTGNGSQLCRTVRGKTFIGI